MAAKKKTVKIAIANQKGGAGKTTTSICVAMELSRRGKKVLFIDSDAQCNSTGFFEAETEDQETLMDILCGDLPAEECIQHTEKGDVIASDPKVSDAENIVKVDERRFSHLKRSCKGIEGVYDYVIIDTPPSIGVELKNVLAYVDYIVIPVDESGWSMSGLMNFADAIELARDNNDNLAVAGILTVKAKEQTKKSARMSAAAEKVAKKMKTKCFKTKIRESVKCAEALTEFCVPLYEYAPSCTTNMDYEAFVNELLKEVK